MGRITERNSDESTAETWGSVTTFPTDDVVVGTPAADNYSTVTCSRDGARFETYFDHRGHKRPFNAVVVIRLAAGPLYPGDTITIVLGDTSGGSRGLAVQTFPETASDFAVFMDPISSGEYKRIYCASPNFRILTGPSEYYTVVAPTLFQAGK